MKDDSNRIGGTGGAPAPVRFSLEVAYDALAGMWIARVPEVAGARAQAFTRHEAIARVRALAIGLVLARNFSEHDTPASEKILVELLELRFEGPRPLPLDVRAQAIN
jgi:predicted RNase H-like HicB family nuclease